MVMQITLFTYGNSNEITSSSLAWLGLPKRASEKKELPKWPTSETNHMQNRV